MIKNIFKFTPFLKILKPQIYILPQSYIKTATRSIINYPFSDNKPPNLKQMI